MNEERSIGQKQSDSMHFESKQVWGGQFQPSGLLLNVEDQTTEDALPVVILKSDRSSGGGRGREQSAHNFN